MSLYATESQRLGLKKEAVRGTAETTPTKWYPTRGNAEIGYSLQMLKDAGIRGIQANFAPVSGIKVGEAKIPLYADPNNLGEFFNSLLGTVSSVQQGGTAAYKHTFTQSTNIQKPAYTLFMDRGLNVLKYNLAVVKSMSFKGTVDGLVEVDAEALFKTEASGAIGTPAFPTQRYHSFQHMDFKLAGSSNTDIKEWSLKIDNTAQAYRTLSLSQDLSDVLAAGKLIIDGGFTIYFQNTTERDKFLANTAVSIRLLSVETLIASTFYNTIDINVYEARYKAFPYGEDQGLLAAKVTFEGFYSSSNSKAIQVDLTNTDVSY